MKGNPLCRAVYFLIIRGNLGLSIFSLAMPTVYNINVEDVTPKSLHRVEENRKKGDGILSADSKELGIICLQGVT